MHIKSFIIYIFRADNGLRKIGITNDLEVRFRGLNTQSAIGIHFEYATKVEDAKRMERKIHAMIATYRKRGEWFDLPDDKVQEIKRFMGGIEVQLQPNKNLIETKMGDYTVFKVKSKDKYYLNCPNCNARGDVGLNRFICKFCEYTTGDICKNEKALN